LKKYREGGWDALLTKRRGRHLGSGRQLGPEDEAYLQQQLRDHTPDQLNLQYALWPHEAVQQLIREETGQTVPIRSITEYFKRWRFTVQKPKKQAYEQQAADVQR